MVGLLNSSNVLQQWYYLFEVQGGLCILEVSQYLQQLLCFGLLMCKYEDWKYILLDVLFNGCFVVDEGVFFSVEQCDVLVLLLDVWWLVFIDGCYYFQLSDDFVVSGVEVSVDNQCQYLLDVLQLEVFFYLIESLVQMVICICVLCNCCLDKLLLLMYIISGLVGDVLNIVYYCYYLVLESGVEVMIVEYYLSFNEQLYFIGG